MLENLKIILIEEILDKLNKYDELMNKINELEEKYESIKLPDYQILLTPKNPQSSKSFIYKVFKNSQYKKDIREYQIKKEEYETIKQKEKESEERYYEEKSKIEEEIEKIKKQIIEENLEEIKEKYKRIKEAKNIKDLGLTIEDVKRLFKEHNIPLVLTDEDQIAENESNFTKEEDLILVHKTKYHPTNDEIKTLTNSKATATKEVNTGKETIKVNFELKRNTIHFYVNGEVSDHVELSVFKKRKYAILIPLKEVPNIENFSTTDTYSKGNVKINKGIILCPEEEIELIQKENPHTIVVGYEGKEDVDGYANILLSLLGYKQEKGNQHSWVNESDVNKLYENLHNIRSFSAHGAHFNSYDQQEELIDTSISFLISLIKKIKEKDIDFDVEYLTDTLTGMNHELHNYQLEVPPTMYDFGYYADAVGKKYEELLKYLEELDINIPYYIKDFRELSKDKSLMFIKDQELLDYLEKCKSKESLNDDKLATIALTHTILKDIKLKKEDKKTI